MTVKRVVLTVVAVAVLGVVAFGAAIGYAFLSAKTDTVC